MAEDWVDKLAKATKNRHEESNLTSALQLHKARVVDAKGGDYWRELVEVVSDAVFRFNEALANPALNAVLEKQRENFRVLNGSGSVTLRCSFHPDKQQIECAYSGGPDMSFPLALRSDQSDNVYSEMGGMRFRTAARLAEWLLSQVLSEI